MIGLENEGTGLLRAIPRGTCPKRNNRTMQETRTVGRCGDTAGRHGRGLLSCGCHVFSLGLLVASSLLSLAQPQAAPSDSGSDPFQYYAAAGKHLAAGEEAQAGAAFRLFLREVLRTLATATAKTGHLDKALPLYEEAVSLAPGDVDLRMEYSRALFGVTKFLPAKEQAQEAVRLRPENPEALLLLGQVLYQLRDYAGASTQLQAAYAKDPEFGTGYLLGKAYLLEHNDTAARALFDSMLRQWGDSDGNHIFIGRAYSQAGYAKEAEAEFRRAMAINPRVRGAHYQLALSYLRGDEAAGYDKAIPELRAELELEPDDFSSHYMLGYIAVQQSRWEEAEKELVRATTLRPKDLQALLALGDTYMATNRPKDAEVILRQALAIAGNQTSREITRAHYLLGRILLSQPGHQEEGKKELALVAEMQKHSGTVLTADARAVGAGSVLREEAEAPAAATDAAAESAGPESHAADQLRASIADSYNNLGAIAGNEKDFATAANYFRRARQWNAALPGLDHNLGMALFYSGQLREAAPLLRSYLAANPDDTAARGALGFSLFKIEDYAGVVEGLRPIQDQMGQTPKLAFVYAASLARTGAYDEGVGRLKALEAANRSLPEIHYELSLAYQHMGRAEDAIQEMKAYEELKK